MTQIQPTFPRPLVLIKPDYWESEKSWFFVYNTKESVETGDFLKGMAGNAPLIINKKTGELRYGTTSESLERQVNEDR